MYNVYKKSCEVKDCFKYPTFNYKGSVHGKFCAPHKFKRMVDVKHKRCIYKKCNTIPHFNYPHDKRRLYCKTHKLKGMKIKKCNRRKNN
jgi:hypothetical protein